MEEEQEMERFDMDGDFEGAEFIEGEFYYRNRKKKRLQTKEEALYGYESSASDSEREERRRRKKRNGLIIEKDLSKPMNFVSAGEPNVGSENAASTSKSGEELNDSQSGLGSGAGLGFGNPGSGFGLGFNSENDQNPGSGFGLGYNPSSGGLGFKLEDDNPVLETPLGRKIHENARQKPPPAAKAKSSGQPKYNWEGHGNAAVSKMMEKMGWKAGTGLGKNEEGITKAIETRARPKNMGLGFGDFVEAGSKKEEEDKADEPPQQKPKASEKLWKKKNRNKVKEYISAEELLKREGEKSGSGRVVEKVLDMTGRQVRVVTDMKNLKSSEQQLEIVEDDTPMPELQHNVRLLVELVESDLRHYDSKLRHEKQTVEILRKDRGRLENQLELQSKSLETMQEIMATIGEVSSQKLSMDGVASVFRKLKLEHPEEFKLWNLSAIALARALPLVAPRFQGWQPLVQPSRGIDAMVLWREVFHEEEEEAIFAEVDNSPFTRLVMEAVMPHVRRAVVNWDARDPEPLLRFFDLWEKLLPPAILHSVLDHLVMPRLNAEVEAWNPLRDTVPVHAWIHPWLPLLGSRMDPICGVIRAKLDSVLEAWHPGDSSAYLMLSPWYPVFDSASWDQLLARKIIPKLEGALRLLEINPAQQRLEYFNWVVSWCPVMPAPRMIGMLVEGFFPKWLDALYRWLSSSNPDFGEVSLWYEGWKSIFPAELLASDRVRRLLAGALQLMGLAVDGKVAEMESLLFQLLREREREFDAPRYHHPLLQQQQEQQQQQGDAEEFLSLKDLLESFATENDVKFLPKVGRMHEGLQVYGFGSVSVSVDNQKQVILAQSGEKWSSVSMGDLLGMHRARRGGKWGS